MAIQISFECKNINQRNYLGEKLCKALVGSPGYINNEILVNYTNRDDNYVDAIIGNNNSEDILIHINAENITLM